MSLRHIAALAFALSAGASSTSAGAQSARPLILVVHGRGQLGRDTADVRREALTSLQAGAREITGDALITDTDLRLVWYADILDSRSRSTATCNTGFGSSLSAPAASPFSVLALLAAALVEAADSSRSTDGMLGARSFVGDLRFLADGGTRCAAEQRLDAELDRARGESRPIVVVAHSLGAMVSWSHLQRRTQYIGKALPIIERFVTLGSPLGSADIRQLVFGEEAPALTTFPAVRAWSNVVDPDDPFAIRVTERSAVQADSALTRPTVENLVTEARAQETHGLVGYLRDRSTVRVVVGAWCRAFAVAEGPVPKSCAGLFR